MGRHSDRAREELLDAAEELFAREGIDAVSNRRITEHAGSANHSAIAYHFGTREDLIRALLSRHLEPMNDRRQQLLAQLGPDPSVHDIIRCRLLPFIDVLNALPRPSWRAQFLSQLRTVPSAVAVIEDLAGRQGLGGDVNSVIAKVEGVTEQVMRARSGILGHLVLGVCAEYEARMNEGTQRGDWVDLGYFLIDAAAGMLSAPVSRSGEPFGMTDRPDLI